MTLPTGTFGNKSCVIDNLEMKIELLTKLADDFNPKISNKLKMIIEDLQA